MREKAFWDRAFESDATDNNLESPDPLFRELIGNPAGRRFLDIGCGSGSLSCWLAVQGADVVGVDGSTIAIERARVRAENCGVSASTSFIEGDLLELSKLVHGPFDRIVGKFVLHHLEPFCDFVASLPPLLHDEAVAVFYENSADNSLLMWARSNLVGRLGIPKFGDEDESPLSSHEVDIARQFFNVEVFYPKFVFFSLFSTYLMRSSVFPSFCKAIPGLLDRGIFRISPWMRRYSYHKIVVLKKQ